MRNAIQSNFRSLLAFLVITGSAGVFPLQVIADDGRSLASQQAISQDELQTFAEAYSQVTQIYNLYEQRITNSSESAQATALQQEANKKMNQAVVDNGLSIEDYNAIYRTIENDPSLQRQFTQALTQVQ